MSVEVALPTWLPLAMGLLFVASTAVRSLALRLRHGINPYVIDQSRPLERFVQSVFVTVTGATMAFLVAYAVWPDVTAALATLPVPRSLERIGFALMIMTISWTVYAQLSMGTSWRIGVPTGDKPALKTHGPFRISRNPIFLGMLGFLFALVLWLPNALTIAALIAAYIAIEVQIRIEETFLEDAHGEAYRAYRARVRRWI